MSYKSEDIVATLQDAAAFQAGDGEYMRAMSNGMMLAANSVLHWRVALVAELERRAANAAQWPEDYEQGAAAAFEHAARLLKGESA